MTVSHLMQLMRSTWEGHHHVCLGRRVNSHQLQRACQIARHATRAGRAGLLRLISVHVQPYRAPARARETRAPDVSTTTGIVHPSRPPVVTHAHSAQTFCLSSVAVHLHPDILYGHAFTLMPKTVDRWTTFQAPIDPRPLHACAGKCNPPPAIANLKRFNKCIMIPTYPARIRSQGATSLATRDRRGPQRHLGSSVREKKNQYASVDTCSDCCHVDIRKIPTNAISRAVGIASSSCDRVGVGKPASSVCVRGIFTPPTWHESRAGMHQDVSAYWLHTIFSRFGSSIDNIGLSPLSPRGVRRSP